MSEEARWRRVGKHEYLHNCPDHEKYRLLHARHYTIKGGSVAGLAPNNTNKLIYNLKKYGSTDASDRRAAIVKCAEEFSGFLRYRALPHDCSYYLVPAPPSKRKDHPEYDDRLDQVGRLICEECSFIQYSPILECIQSRERSHQGEPRTAERIYRTTRVIKEAFPLVGPKDLFILIDDVLTSGATFEGCCRRIQEALEAREMNNPIIGLFWARAVERP